jgi:hypothetical protein
MSTPKALIGSLKTNSTDVSPVVSNLRTEDPSVVIRFIFETLSNPIPENKFTVNAPKLIELLGVNDSKLSVEKQLH